jgi:MFS family permease
MSKNATTTGIIALCACAFGHSYLLISVFSYSGFIAIDLIPSVDEENAGTYAGLIASAFMFGRSITSYGWGQIADVYGRTFVLLASLMLSLVFSILFGLSTSFPLALFWRFFL